MERRRTCTDDLDCLIFLRMHDGEQSLTRRVADRHEPLLAARRARIAECRRERVVKHTDRLLEGHFMLPEVRLGFLPMPNEVHSPSAWTNVGSAIVVDVGSPVRVKR